MLSLSNKRLYGREEMLRALLRAGQFAHLSEETLSASMDDLWNVEKRLAWIAEDHRQHCYTRATWAERAVSMALVKAAETGLLPPNHFDAQTVDWVSRTQAPFCCLCSSMGASGGLYEVPLDFVCYVLPTFLRLDVPYHVRRPLCSKCAWAVCGRVWREQGMTVPVSAEPDFWGEILARMPTLKAFNERVRINAKNRERLRFDPRRVPERIAA